MGKWLKTWQVVTGWGDGGPGLSLKDRRRAGGNRQDSGETSCGVPHLSWLVLLPMVPGLSQGRQPGCLGCTPRGEGEARARGLVRYRLGERGRRGERVLPGDGPLSGEGERCWLGEDRSNLGERLRAGEQLPLLGEKALVEVFQPRRGNSALLLPGEAARPLGHGLRGEGL